MDIKTALNQALKDAMRANDPLRRTTLRIALAAIKQVEIDQQITLDDAAIIGILHRQVKMRNETLTEAQKAGRLEMAAEAEAEIAILAEFLPKGLSEAELLALAQEAIKEVGATSPAETGAVMKVLMPRVRGRAPGGQVSEIVGRLLQK